MFVFFPRMNFDAFYFSKKSYHITHRIRIADQRTGFCMSLRHLEVHIKYSLLLKGISEHIYQTFLPFVSK